METWTKTCGPHPGGLILTHTHVVCPWSIRFSVGLEGNPNSLIYFPGGLSGFGQLFGQVGCFFWFAFKPTRKRVPSKHTFIIGFVFGGPPIQWFPLSNCGGLSRKVDVSFW